MPHLSSCYSTLQVLKEILTSLLPHIQGGLDGGLAPITLVLTTISILSSPHQVERSDPQRQMRHFGARP